MGLGWQFAFEQWGSLYTDVKTKRVTLPISCKTAIGAFAEDNGTAAIDMCASAGNNYVDISLEDSNIVYAGCFWIHIGWQTQWGSNALNLNGATQEIALPLNINYAAAAVMTMRSGDFPGYVACPYWSECSTSTIRITPDYEIGQGYAGTGQANVTWILLSF